MGSTGRQHRWHQWVLVAAVLLLVLTIPAEGAVAGGSTPPAPGVEPRSATVSRPQAAKAEEKVTICHRTNSRTNPYNQIVVSKSSAISGHASHRGPIFAPDVENWGDIIAPIRPGLPAGRNWPEGRVILHNGCEMQPDVGPLPGANIGGVDCTGTNPNLDVTVTNDSDASRPAFFRILASGTVVARVGPIAPGASQTVTLSGDLQALEDQTVTIEVRSGGEVISSRVITVDCAPGPPAADIGAQLVCAGRQDQGTFTVTNNGQSPIELTETVNGTPVGTPVTVAPGATQSGSVDLSTFEDQTITAAVLVDGQEVATYTVTPNCVPPQADPAVGVAAVECPPPTATVTLSNNGDPDSKVRFVIRINGKIAQVSAPLYGGDTTTIVGDLSRFEDQTVTVELRARGTVIGERTVHVNCKRALAVLKVQKGTGCVKSRRFVEVTKRVHIRTVRITHNPPRTRWVVTAHTQSGHLMHSGKHGRGSLVTHVRWVFHTPKPANCHHGPGSS